MLNYIKSELYRIFHSKGIYIMTGICSGLLLAMNLVLWSFAKIDGFGYATVDASFPMLTSSMGAVLFLTVCLASIVYNDEFKNRTICNSVAYGLSRIQIYLGKLIASLAPAFFCLIVTEGTLIGSGYLLLDHQNHKALTDVLTATGAYIPCFIASLFAAITFFYFMKSANLGTWVWGAVVVVVPMIISLFGLKFDICLKISEWMLYQVVTAQKWGESGMVYLWMTQEGMIRCLLVGLFSIVIFVAAGIIGMRKKEM